ncbi:MAG: acetoin utilization protein AcuC, partial [Tagaea sp.]
MALFIGSDIYRRSRYGSNHPLAIPRVSTCIDLCRALGWLPEARYLDSPIATRAELARFHNPAYVDAVIAAEAAQSVDEETSLRHNLGRGGNPVFGEIFRRPATACGAALAAADRLASGATTRIYSPAGGTHHGRKDQASGFCYFNDPVLAILRLLDRGLARVAYVDLDAHHCDGVEEALAGEPRVRLYSIHEAGRWPNTGAASDTAGGIARNFPVPEGLNDTEFAFLVEEAILPSLVSFAPQALIVQGGADALEDDPLSNLGLSNRALWRALDALLSFNVPTMTTGGGGYNPWSVARAWTGMWARIAGHESPERLPPEAEAILRALTWHRRKDQIRPEHWFTTLADDPREGPIRDEVRALASHARKAA